MIDMSSSNGIKIWNAATEALEPRFDGTAGKIFGFLEQVQAAIVERGWTTINPRNRAVDSQLRQPLDRRAPH
jgi:hypothetical protein